MLADRAISVAVLSMLLGPITPAQQLAEGGRIRAPEEIRETRPPLLAPLEVLSWPFHKLSIGAERGFIAFERHKIRERVSLWTEELRRHGVEARFGGSIGVVRDCLQLLDAPPERRREGRRCPRRRGAEHQCLG